MNVLNAVPWLLMFALGALIFCALIIEEIRRRKNYKQLSDAMTTLPGLAAQNGNTRQIEKQATSPSVGDV